MSHSERASNFLFGSTAKSSIDPPKYNEVMQMRDLPSAPLLEQSGIFGETTTVQFEWNSSDVDSTSFLIRDTDGSLQAKGEVRGENTTVRSINGMELLKITEQDVDEENGRVVHTFGVYHKNAFIGTVKVTENSQPNTSLQILCRNPSRPQITVNSLNIGDYTIFRQNLMSKPLCNLQMPNAETFNSREFNIKIIFHPQTGITEEEQLLCTAAAISFKNTMRKLLKIKEAERMCIVNFGKFLCFAVFVVVLVGLYFSFYKLGCERKKSQGLSAYRNMDC